MKRWTQSQVLELLRRVLFGTFLLCSVGIGLLVSNPSWVDQLDQSLVASYSNRYKERFAEANKLILENDPASDQLAIARIEALLDDLESVGKTDRLGSIKNRCFSVGIKALVRTNRLELAREWVARWMRFDDKNLNTVVLAATIETGLGEAQAAFSHLEDLYSLVPEWNVASSAYSRMLIRQERYVDAAKVILESPTLVAAPRWSEPWTVYWAEGRGFSSGDRTTVKPVLDSHGKIQFSINATNLKTHLRIDLPAFLAGTLVRPELKIQDQQGSSTIIKLWEPKVHFHQVHRRESRIDSPGEPSPHFWLALPTEFQNKAITVKFQAETEPLGLLQTCCCHFQTTMRSRGSWANVLVLPGRLGFGEPDSSHWSTPRCLCFGALKTKPSRLNGEGTQRFNLRRTETLFDFMPCSIRHYQPSGFASISPTA